MYLMILGISRSTLLTNDNDDRVLFTFQIFLYYDVILPSMTVSPLNPMQDLESDEMQLLEKLLGECSVGERQQKIQQLTEWLLYGGY